MSHILCIYNIMSYAYIMSITRSIPLKHSEKLWVPLYCFILFQILSPQGKRDALKKFPFGALDHPLYRI